MIKEYNLKTYPKNGTHWEKNVWKERLEKALRETPFKDLVGTPNPYESFDDTDLESEVYRKGFFEGVFAAIQVVLGESDKVFLEEASS